MQENIQTQDKVAAEFKKDLAALLKKYSRKGPVEWKAEIILAEKCTSFSREHWIEVWIPSLYDENDNLLREYVEINLGQSFAP